MVLLVVFLYTNKYGASNMQMFLRIIARRISLAFLLKYNQKEGCMSITTLYSFHTHTAI